MDISTFFTEDTPVDLILKHLVIGNLNMVSCINEYN